MPKKQTKKTAKAVTIRKRSGSADNAIGLTAFQTEPYLSDGGNVMSLQPVPMEVGGFTYNNPTAQLPQVDPGFVANAPGSPMPVDSNVYTLNTTPAPPPTATPPIVPTGTTTTATDKPFDPWPTDALIWIVPVLILVAIGIYYYSKKK